MKAHLQTQIQNIADKLVGMNFTREYLQALILSSLQRAGAMVPLAFHGGTALRFLYGTQRYSEDLDFALEKSHEIYDYQFYMRAIRSDLNSQGYGIELKINDQKVVHSAFIRFPGLLFNLGLSPQRDEVLAVKIEVDTEPPEGAQLETTVIRRHVILNLQHHDRSSLLAGKLHAVLQRKYLKGRDIYDLLWYLSNPKWPAPNFEMLNHALQQTGWEGKWVQGENWREIVRTRLKQADWQAVVDDVSPFVEMPHELKMLTRDTIIGLLS